MAGPVTRAMRQAWAYVRILLGVLTKRGWKYTPGQSLPTAQAHLLMSIEPSRLELLLREIPLYPQKRFPIAYAPAAYFTTQAFPCVLECLAALPFPVLGGLVNKKAEYKVLTHDKDVEMTDTDHILHSVHVVPMPRTTPGGHMEFDMTITSMHTPSGHLLFEATLTLVKLLRRPHRSASTSSPSPSHASVPQPSPPPASTTTTTTTTTAPPARDNDIDIGAHTDLNPASSIALQSSLDQSSSPNVQSSMSKGVPTNRSATDPNPMATDPSPTPLTGGWLLTEMFLPSRLGWRWALLDGDLSPMHLSRFTARLVGFRTVIANVHCVCAHVEAAMMAQGIIPKGTGTGTTITNGSGVNRPYTITATFKRPIPIPTRLKLWSSLPCDSSSATSPSLFVSTPSKSDGPDGPRTIKYRVSMPNKHVSGKAAVGTGTTGTAGTTSTEGTGADMRMGDDVVVIEGQVIVGV